MIEMLKNSIKLFDRSEAAHRESDDASERHTAFLQQRIEKCPDILRHDQLRSLAAGKSLECPNPAGIGVDGLCSVVPVLDKFSQPEDLFFPGRPFVAQASPKYARFTCLCGIAYGIFFLTCLSQIYTITR